MTFVFEYITTLNTVFTQQRCSLNTYVPGIDLSEQNIIIPALLRLAFWLKGTECMKAKQMSCVSRYETWCLTSSV